MTQDHTYLKLKMDQVQSSLSNFGAALANANELDTRGQSMGEAGMLNNE